MVISPDAVANAFYDLAQSHGSRDFTPMKLQKLVYFAHGWHLAIYKAPLISEPIQAWKWGPVVQSLYREFKQFGNSPINRKAIDMAFENGQLSVVTPEIQDQLQRSLVGRIWEVFGNYAPGELMQMTHASGSPWDQVAATFDYQLPMGITIPDELIQAYFTSQMQK